MRVYISGKITGLPILAAKEKFKWHAGYLELKGHDPVNPMDLPHKNHEWIDYIVTDIRALLECDAIYMLNCWGQSLGARIEYGIAKEMGMTIIYQGDLKYESSNQTTIG